MILKTNTPKKRIILSGPDGNAFVLLGYAKALCHQLKLDDNKIIREMQSGYYDDLVLTFDRYFGDYVEIIDDIDLIKEGKNGNR